MKRNKLNFVYLYIISVPPLQHEDLFPCIIMLLLYAHTLKLNMLIIRTHCGLYIYSIPYCIMFMNYYLISHKTKDISNQM